MKKYFKGSIILVFLFLLNMLIVSAGPLQIGDILKKETQTIDGINYQYMEILDSNNYKQKLFYADFLPGQGSKYEIVIHSISDETDDYIGSTVLDIAKDYEEKTNNKVMVAINGDFFAGDYSPIGYDIRDNNIIHDGPSSWMHEIGFDNLGNAVAGNIESFIYKITVYTDTETREFVVDKFNELPVDGEISLLEPALFSQMNEVNSGKYLIQTADQTATTFSYPLVGSSYRLKRGQVVNDETLNITSGQLGICIKGDNEISQFFFNEFTHGTNVKVEKVATGNFYGMPWIIGGRHILVDKGTLLPKGYPANDEMAPRTTVGVTTEGKYFVMIVDGRQPEYSKGITIQQQGLLAYDLGAYTALEIDGGGSSSFLLRIDDLLTVMNQPSDAGNVLRKVSNAVLIVEKDEDRIITTTEETTTTTIETTTTTVLTTTTEVTATTIEQTTTTENNDSTDATEDGGFNIIYLVVPIVVLGGIGLAVGITRSKK